MKEEKKTNYATVAYDSAYSGDLQKLCLKLGIKKKDFLEKSISFFRQTDLDPREPQNVISPIKTIENRLIGFLKVQDKNAEVHHQHLQNQINTIAETQQELLRILSSFLNSTE